MVGKSVLELGSYNVNGSVREFFEAPGRYIGVDWRPGPGVDHVSLFHEIPWIGEFDVLISCNAFEHDPYWERSIEAGIMALKPGGEIMLCCAGPGYAPHEIQSAPKPEHYANINPDEFSAVLRRCGARGVMTLFTEPADLAYHGHKLSASDA